MIFDSHSHYDDEAFDEDRDELLSSMASKGVGDIVCAAASWDSLKKIKNLCEKYPFLHPTYGIHPENVDELTPERRPVLEEMIRTLSPVAIGEIGLDYYYDTSTKEAQKEIFIYQLELAKKYDLPVIVHSREATMDTLNIIKEHTPQKKGVIHCFSSSLEIAKEYVKMGFYIGVGGVVTFKNSKTLKEVTKGIPLSSILIETDCPYLAPVPFRGKRNDSSYLTYVAEEIASLKEITSEEVIKETEKNARTLFNL